METQHQSPEVFISYKREQKSIAYEFYNELEDHNIKCWLDVEELPEDPGQEYIDKIQKAINKCQIFLLVYSEEVNHSKFIIEKELEYAEKKEKQILCFPVDKIETMEHLALKRIFQEKQVLLRFDELKDSKKMMERVKDEEHRNYLNSLLEDGIQQDEDHYISKNKFLVRIAIQRKLGIPSSYGVYKGLESIEGIFTRGASKKDIMSVKNVDITVLNKSLFIDIPENKLQKLKELRFIREPETEEDFEIPRLLEKLQPEQNELITKLRRFIQENYEDEIDNIDTFLRETAERTADRFIDEIESQHKTMFNGAMLGIYDLVTQRRPNSETFDLYLSMYHSDYFTFKFTVELYHRLYKIKNCFKISTLADIQTLSPFLCSLGVGGFVVIKQQEHLSLMWTKRSNNISSGKMWHFSYDETVNVLKDAERDKDGTIKINEEDKSIKINVWKNFFRAIKEENGLLKDLLNGPKGLVEIGIIMSDRLEIEILSFATVELNITPSISKQLRKYTNNASDGKLEIEKMEFKSLFDSTNPFCGMLMTPESEALAERLGVILSNKDIFRLREDLKLGENVIIVDGDLADIGKNVIIEDNCYISSGVKIGDNCKIHRNVFIDENVVIGDNVKIQNNNSIYHGVILEDGVFVGTNVSFTNDKYPRSINPDGSLKTGKDWTLVTTVIKEGASIGSGATIVCGNNIGKWAMVGAGSVVVKSVPDYALVVGCPAKIIKEKIEK